MMKALVAIDASPSMERVVELAAALLAGKEMEVTVLHALPQYRTFARGAFVVIKRDDGLAAHARGEALVAATAKRLRLAGVGPSIAERVEGGDPAETILCVADETGADLIVVGSDMTPSARPSALPSVSARVAARARCTVILARPTDRRPSRRGADAVSSLPSHAEPAGHRRRDYPSPTQGK